MIKNYQDSLIWIIGASSGIGRALATDLSQKGATLVLSARREEELIKLNEELGGKHHVYALDASDSHSIFKAATNISAKLPKLDSMIYMAAAYVPTSFQDTDIDHIRKALDVNLTGAMAAVLAVHQIYKKQGFGQIALCASVAGYKGLPNAQPYSATKAAMINLAETLRTDLQNDNIDVKIINPGFVRTPLTDKNDFKMPMIIEPEIAAQEIAKGLMSNKFELHFPKKFTYIVKLISILPYSLFFAITRKMVKS